MTRFPRAFFCVALLAIASTLTASIADAGRYKRGGRKLIVSYIQHVYDEGLALPASRAAIYGAAIDQMFEYDIEVNTKVLDACIAFSEEGEQTATLLGLFAARTDIASDGAVPTNRLAIRSKRTCQGWAARAGVDCGCVTLDKNGKNVFDFETPR